jgi:hypothetical protein
MKPPVILSLLLLSLFSGCDWFHSPTAPEATLSGHVIMKSTGGPYYPSTVALLDGHTQDFPYASVNTQGEYRFRSVKPGSYLVVLTLGQGAGTREGPREPIEIVPGANVRDFTVP